MPDVLENVPILFNCPAEDCPGEIKSTFGKLMANPEIICPVCRVKTEITFSEEELAQARAALPSADNAGAALDSE